MRPKSRIFARGNYFSAPTASSLPSGDLQRSFLAQLVLQTKIRGFFCWLGQKNILGREITMEAPLPPRRLSAIYRKIVHATSRRPVGAANQNTRLFTPQRMVNRFLMLKFDPSFFLFG